MPESVGSYEAKTHLPQLLERVAQGEEFMITKHGHVVARLSPPSDAPTRHDIQTAIEAIRAFRKGQTLGGLSLRQLREEGRR